MHDSKLIDALGGTVEVAELCELTTGAVSQWRINGIPKGWKRFFRSHRPDVYQAWEGSMLPSQTMGPPAAGRNHA
ncbi:hypothetical protein CAL29_28185 [Bordetella genomosp. 10]|uniref:Rha family transcriptional regulator n=1 Tax=Bordetella genomosp. 10 TaxID=1416804 RepID=A0A261S591_9BORD|nr:hypothetical protein CAL29_28185 [Bordetella genomosp. 10]